MAGPLLAQYLGGGADSMLGNFMLAFVAAVAFATIVAVVAGLVLAAASAMAHDLYVGVIREEHVTPQEQVRAARIATVIVGAMAITIGIAAKGQNVAHLVALAFAVAASANFPCVLLTLYWRKCNTGGIVAGMVVGTLLAVGLVLVSPNMTYPKAVRGAAEKVLAADGPKRAAAEADIASGDAAKVATAQKIDRRARPCGDEGEGRHRARQGREHVARGPRGTAVRPAQPGPDLDPARLPRGHPRFAALPRQARRRHVGRAVRAPEHRHPGFEGGRALTQSVGARTKEAPARGLFLLAARETL